MTAQEHVEALARELHEAGRAAEQPGPLRGFVEWAELAEPAREGRRAQARFLIARGYINLYALPILRGP